MCVCVCGREHNTRLQGLCVWGGGGWTTFAAPRDGTAPTLIDGALAVISCHSSSEEYHICTPGVHFHPLSSTDSLELDTLTSTYCDDASRCDLMETSQDLCLCVDGCTCRHLLASPLQRMRLESTPAADGSHDTAASDLLLPRHCDRRPAGRHSHLLLLSWPSHQWRCSLW